MVSSFACDDPVLVQNLEQEVGKLNRESAQLKETVLALQSENGRLRGGGVITSSGHASAAGAGAVGTMDFKMDGNPVASVSIGAGALTASHRILRYAVVQPAFKANQDH